MKKLLIILLSYFIIINFVLAQNRISLIRDTEIETFIKEISKPILISAGLNPDDINFYIVNDNNINAFVTGGQNIFINTGTLISFDTPDAVLGIIAHEIGHISAGHLAQFNEKIKGTQSIGIGSILAGIGAMLAGIPELGQAVIFGGLQIQQQNLLKYTRGQEEMADDLAVKYLHNNTLSANALLHSMNKFYQSELGYSNDIEYYLTHPLSKNRKRFIERKMQDENVKDNNIFNTKYKDRFNFIKTKILAYNNKLLNLNNTTKNDYIIYANAIIAMNTNKYKEAFQHTEYLIHKYKNNPYFYELLGDIYLKQNQIHKALLNYNIADNIIKDNTLIKKMIAFIIIKYNQKNMYNIAINNLIFITNNDKDDLSSLKMLAEVYYKNNDLSLSYLTLAKYYEFKNEKSRVKEYIDLAKKNTTNKTILKKIEDFTITLEEKK